MNQLVQQAGNGDIKAQETLLRHLAPRIDKIVRQYEWVHGVERDDLRQEAYMAVIEGLDRVDPSIGSSTEYLIKFARWRLLDSLKKILRRKGETISEQNYEAILNSDASKSAEMELLDQKLTDVQRHILQFLAAGYTWREIGEKMGFTAANVSHHLKQIRKVYG